MASGPKDTRMPVTKRRPKPAGAGRAGASVKEGGVARQAGGAATGAELVPLVLRIPRKVLDRVDGAVDARRTKNPIPRTTWLLEAVNEKLGREKN